MSSSVVKNMPQHSKVYCHCHLKCVLFTCHRGHNSGRQFYRCVYNRSEDDCSYFKWVDELEDPSYVTHYELKAYEARNSKNFDSIRLMLKVLLVMVFIDITARVYFG
ncbi:hypothetical protein MA16_Dca011514 [Dendrobium catenatum]|uniref:GRF-type domain-containing protein n=1 Tax=Dendrobium catenatum TaxID=906689 RepID=A0A2I0VFM8_9ASPA|nr:hypothetical protein MA16_Dca011514 [Dendrobium catenatum]